VRIGVLRISLAVELIKLESYICSATIGVNSQATILATRNARGAPGQHLVDTLHAHMASL